MKGFEHFFITNRVQTCVHGQGFTVGRNCLCPRCRWTHFDFSGSPALRQPLHAEHCRYCPKDFAETEDYATSNPQIPDVRPEIRPVSFLGTRFIEGVSSAGH